MPFIAPDVISVSTLNRLARDLLETGLPPVWISGELSNLTLAASGHAYFSLKDQGAQVRCVMFRSRLALLPFKPGNGMQLELKGCASLYEARGEFQINVEAMRQAGLGSLFEAFEQLKARLAAEGLFEQTKKRPLPFLPRAVGIITSAAAAALRDVVTTLTRRMPGLAIILYPTPVQGSDAALQISQAIELACQRAETDVLIVCRGGGSIEDLWSFNEEVVARAISRSTIPVVSGVGHETDFTICDFVADLRAPTPTAAAELAVPAKSQLEQQLALLAQALQRATTRQVSTKTQQLDLLAQRLKHPGERLTQQRQYLAFTQQRLNQQIHYCMQKAGLKLELATQRFKQCQPDLANPARRLDRAGQQLQNLWQQSLLTRQTALTHLAGLLESFNPDRVLQRGFAIVQKMDNRVVSSTVDLRQGERVRIRLADGQTEASIDHPPGAQSTLPF